MCEHAETKLISVNVFTLCSSCHQKKKKKQSPCAHTLKNSIKQRKQHEKSVSLTFYSDVPVVLATTHKFPPGLAFRHFLFPYV